MVRLNWTERAKEDLKSIAAYISIDSVHYAEKQVEKFFEATDILFEFPTIGRPVPEYSINSLRQILVGKYRIIYLVVSESQVDILTVHHSARILNLEI